MNTLQKKQLAIAESIMHTAMVVSHAAKELPNTGKRRNIFIKTYNRRPQNKKKRTILITQMMLNSCMGAARIAQIVSTPIPKYAKGSV